MHWSGDPYWKVDNPIWTRVKTIHWPGHKQVGRPREWKCLVSQVNEGISHARIVNSQCCVVAKLTWDNGQAVQLYSTRGFAHVSHDADIWEIQVRADSPGGQLHSCVLETSPVKKTNGPIQTSRLPINFFERLDVLSRLN